MAFRLRLAAFTFPVENCQASRYIFVNSTTPNDSLSEIAKRHNRLLRELNDIHIFVSKAVPLIAFSNKVSADKLKQKKHSAFKVPGVDGKSAIALRKPLHVMALMQRFQKGELYENLLVSVVSRFEFYLTDIMAIFLEHRPEKLAIGPKGGESNTQIPIQLILKATTLEQLRTFIIQQRVQAVLYAEPKEYLVYFNAISEVRLTENQCLPFFEIKATRDLIVHNSLCVNELYLKKAGILARGQFGQKLGINRKYFEESIGHMKTLANNIKQKADKKLSNE